MSEYFSTVLNEKAADLLRAVINTGLYGDGETEVVACMLLKGVQEAVANRFVTLPGPEPEPQDEPAEAPPSRYRCEVCHDGTLSPPGMTPIGDCQKCGAACIPF